MSQSEWSGYTDGEPVEALDDGRWEPAIIFDFDLDDDGNPTDSAPISVKFSGSGDLAWKIAAHVRLPVDKASSGAAVGTVTPIAEPRRQLQYRIDRTSGPTLGRNAGSWTNIEVGASSVTTVNIPISPSANYQRVALREMLPHTDDEILAALRKLPRISLPERARDILDGKF